MIDDCAEDLAELGRLRRERAALLARVVEDRGEGMWEPIRFTIRLPSRSGYHGLYEIRGFPTREEAEAAWEKAWLEEES